MADAETDCSGTTGDDVKITEDAYANCSRMGGYGAESEVDADCSTVVGEDLYNKADLDASAALRWTKTQIAGNMQLQPGTGH